MSEKKLYLLDAHALCYRAFYAIKGLTNSKGQPTNAVYGFVNALRKTLKDFNPEYFAVCFDKDGKGFRQEKYAEYKIQRPAMPDDLRSQMSLIHDMVNAYALPVLEISGYEADDLIAAAVKNFSDQVEVVVITDDKDLFQLVNHRVKVYSPRKEKILNGTDVNELLGVAPEYVTDFLGLAGDASDNIPGVAGVGKVTAQKLIKEFGCLENIYASLDKISSLSVRKKLEDEKTEAFLSRELAQLRDDAPINVRLEDLKIRPEDPERLYELFTQLEFHRFAAEIKPPVETVKGGQTLSSSSEGVMAENIVNNEIMAFCYDPAEEVFLVTDGKSFSRFSPADILKHDGKIFENPDIVKVTYDIKQQYKILWNLGIDVRGQVVDLMLAGYVLNPVRNGHELGVLSWNFLKQMRPADASLLDDLQTIYRLYQPVIEALNKREAARLFHDIEMPLSRLLARIELAGVRLNIDLLKKLSVSCQKKMTELEGEIYRLAGGEFNINSPKQLGCVLFEKLALPAMKRTKTGFSTNEEVLHRLAEQHELPKMIIDYRQLAKLKSTYIDALPQLTETALSKDGRKRNIIHTSFNQTITETGRLSSSNPNLQNIPIRTELGREIRRAFIPLEEDHLLLSADYSQIELRILAHLSEDENLIKAFHEGEDIHAYTAGLMFECPSTKVTETMRYAAKRVNFGIIYGMSAFGLSKDLNIPKAEAQDFIDRYFLRYPKVRTFIDHVIAKCRETGYAETMMNRRRDIPEIVSKNMNIRMFAERQAVNTPVQGTAPDLIKLAMVNVQKHFDRKKYKTQMLITVHDEIIFDLVPAEKKEVVPLIKHEMESAMTLKVPIKVTVKLGKNWLEMEKAA